MSKKIFLTAAIIGLSLCLLAGASFGKEEKAGLLQRIKNAYANFRNKQKTTKAPGKETPKTAVPKAAAPKIQTPKVQAAKKEMKSDEQLADLRESLTDNEELLGAVPGVKAEQGADGKIYFTFNGVKLEELSKEDLDNLSVKIHQALVKIRTDRIQAQLETTRQVQRLQGAAAPRAPSAYIAPQPSRTPPTPPSTPRTPPAPPPAPARRY